MNPLAELSVKPFADGADIDVIARMSEDSQIQEFTTNPTLMRKAKVLDYKDFAHEVLAVVGDRPVSFEVFSDGLEEMEAQAMEIASWGENVFVKIPVPNTEGAFTGTLIKRLCLSGVKVNVSAILTLTQVIRVVGCLDRSARAFISVFAGRIADTGRDPIPVMSRSLAVLRDHPLAELIWASSREVLNVVQAISIGCPIITATADILAKLSLGGKDLDIFSLETVRMFRQDAIAAGYSIEGGTPHDGREFAGPPSSFVQDLSNASCPNP